MIGVIYTENIALPDGASLVNAPIRTKKIAIDRSRIAYFRVNKSNLFELWQKTKKDSTNQYFDLWIAKNMIDKNEIPEKLRDILCFGSVLVRGDEFLVPCIRREVDGLKIDYIEINHSDCQGYLIGYLAPQRRSASYFF